MADRYRSTRSGGGASGGAVDVSFDDSEIIGTLEALARNLPEEFAQGAFEEMLVEADECRRLCPKDTLDLSESIGVTEPTIEGGLIQCSIVCGSPETEDYAIVQHEDLSLNHDGDEQAKFIEQPLLQSSPHMLGRIGRRVDLTRAAGR